VPIRISVPIAFKATAGVRADTGDYPKPGGYLTDFGDAIDANTKERL
jgi:hypothetical protein